MQIILVHLIFPARDLLRTGMMSPGGRGTTPELLMTTSMVVDQQGGHNLSSNGASPRNPRQKVRRNHTFNLSSSGEDSHSPFRNQRSYGED